MNEIEAQLRDEFAGKALQGMLTSSYANGWEIPPLDERTAEKYADAAYKMADAMLERRRK